MERQIKTTTKEEAMRTNGVLLVGKIEGRKNDSVSSKIEEVKEEIKHDDYDLKVPEFLLKKQQERKVKRQQYKTNDVKTIKAIIRRCLLCLIRTL